MDPKENEPIKKLGKFAANIVKSKIKGKVKKTIVLPILSSVAPFLLIAIAIIIVIGGVSSFGDSIMDFFNSDPELSEMTEEERIAWINDPENLYEELENIDSLLDLDNSNMFLMDEATIKRIFTRIHVYNQRREKSTGQLSYGNRVEHYTGDMSSTSGSVGMAAMEPNGELPSNVSADYDTAWNYTEVYRSSVEKEMENDGTGRFDLRWQDIFVACALAARDNVDDHSLKSDQDMDTTDLDELDMSEYYLTNDEIDEIIDIFYYEFDYLYDPVDSPRKRYGFKSFINLPSAFRLQIEITETTVTNEDETQSKEYQRITYRIPEAAPKEIHNRFVRYIYNYEDNICVSRDCQIIPDELVEACREYIPAFDLEEFVEMLELLPGTEDLAEFYSSFEKTEAGYMPNITSTSDPNECPSIGVIYSPGKDGGSGAGTSGGSGAHDTPTGWENWEIGTTDLIYYDYINGNIHRIAIKVEGKDYGIYKVHEPALSSYLQSDNLTADQLVSLFNSYSCFSNSSNILFSSDENKLKTAETLVQVQNEENVSVLFFLAIMRIEGAIGTDMGAHWNFFNIEASSKYGRPSIPGHSRFCDYTQIMPDAWTALARQIKSIKTWYADNYNQTNAFLFCFQGYTSPDWSLIYHSYCPAWDDCAFPWAAGSGIGSPTGIGWVNNVGDYRYDFQQFFLNSGG